MKNRIFSTLCSALILIAASVDALAQQMKPVVVASLAGYNEIIKDIGFLGKAADMPELPQTVEGLIGFVTQFQGLAGLDKTKPIGVALNTDGAQFQVIGFVPVADLDKLLAALVGVLGEATDAGDGCKSVRVKNFPLLMKEQGGWAYISYSKEAFNNLPKDPSELLGGLNKDYDLGLRAFVQNIPAPFRDIGLQQLQMGMQQGMQRLPNESDEQFDARRKLTEMQISALSDALTEIDQITMGFAIDSIEHRAYMDTVISVLPDGKLAKQLAGMKNLKTQHGGFLLDDAVATAHLASVMSEADITQTLAMIDAGRKQAAAEIEKKARGSDEEKQKVTGWLNQVLDVLADTVKGGSLSAGGAIVGDGPLTAVAGATLVGAERLEKIFKEVIAYAETRPEFGKLNVDIEYNAETHKGVRFHTVTIPLPDNGGDAEKAKEFLGDDLVLTVGFGKGSAYIAIGEDGIETLIDVIDESAETSDDVQPMTLTVSLAPIMSLAARSEPNKAELRIMADALKQGDDRIVLTSTTKGLSQIGRLEVEEGVIRSLGLAAKAAAAKKQRN